MKNNATRLLGWAVHNAPVIVLALIIIFTALMTDRFFTQINLRNILLQASIISVLSMGMTFVIISGGFDLSVGAIVAAAGCAAAWAMLQVGVVFGIGVGLLVGLVTGVINGTLVV